jgi:sarcosine oxidase subunit gamma
MADRIASRRAALDDATMFTTPGVTVSPASPAARLVLRVDPAAAAAKGTANGFDLTGAICTVTGSAERFAARLGPNEWLLVAPLEEAGSLAARLGEDLAEVFHSLVDVSHRNTALHLSGARVADVLSAGCTLDLAEAAFPPGKATRTLLGKAEVVLLRPADASQWRIEVWRSFAPYVYAYLNEAAR